GVRASLGRFPGVSLRPFGAALHPRLLSMSPSGSKAPQHIFSLRASVSSATSAFMPFDCGSLRCVPPLPLLSLCSAFRSAALSRKSSFDGSDAGDGGGLVLVPVRHRGDVICEGLVLLVGP